MKKYFSLLVLSAALFGAGCGNKKKAKVTLEQKETVTTNFVQEEQAADAKEDYSVIA